MLAPLLLVTVLATGDPQAGPTPAEAVALAAPTFKGEEAKKAAAGGDDGVVLRAWGQRPGTWLALVPERGASEVGNFTAKLHIALIARKGDRWVALARSDQDRESPTEREPAYSLNLAPFKLNDREVAFGVREHSEYSSTARSDTTEQLILYRVVGTGMAPVLELTSLSLAFDKEDGTGGGDRAVVAVSKHKTGGFFDLVVTTMEDGERKRRKKVETFAWTGDAYEKK